MHHGFDTEDGAALVEERDECTAFVGTGVAGVGRFVNDGLHVEFTDVFEHGPTVCTLLVTQPFEQLVVCGNQGCGPCDLGRAQWQVHGVESLSFEHLARGCVNMQAPGAIAGVIELEVDLVREQRAFSVRVLAGDRTLDEESLQAEWMLAAAGRGSAFVCQMLFRLSV